MPTKNTSRMNMVGQVLGRLTVLRAAQRGPDRRTAWLCRCSCGTETIVTTKGLRKGTKSCGCLIRDTTRNRSLRHGHCRRDCETVTHRTWMSMVGRCRHTTGKDARWYFDRGIKVCDRWMTYENFLADMGEKPKGMSIDRIDNDGNYEPGNCRWATPTQQSRNMRTVPKYTFGGRTMSARDWADEYGIPSDRVTDRMYCGWSLERALTTPVKKKAASA